MNARSEETKQGRAPIKVVAISGSLRKDSYNRKALQVAKQIAAQEGAVVEELDLRELKLPIYDEDLQAQGFPEPVQRLKAAIEAADVVVIASPEYNYSIPGGLKNAIDWLSRGKNSLDGKYAVLLGASTGAYGTVRMQPHLRQVLGALNVTILPQPQVLIRSAKTAFNPDGSLADPKVADQLGKLVKKTLAMASALKD